MINLWMNSFFDIQVQFLLFSFEAPLFVLFFKPSRSQVLFFYNDIQDHLRAARSAKASPTFLFWFSGSSSSSAKPSSLSFLFCYSGSPPICAKRGTEIQYFRFVIQDLPRSAQSAEVKPHFFVLIVKIISEPREARESYFIFDISSFKISPEQKILFWILN